jgi:hypothetical protein
LFPGSIVRSRSAQLPQYTQKIKEQMQHAATQQRQDRLCVVVVVFSVVMQPDKWPPSPPPPPPPPAPSIARTVNNHDQCARDCPAQCNTHTHTRTHTHTHTHARTHTHDCTVYHILFMSYAMSIELLPQRSKPQMSTLPALHTCVQQCAWRYERCITQLPKHVSTLHMHEYEHHITRGSARSRMRPPQKVGQ